MADTNKVVQLSAFDMGNPTSTLEVVNTPRPSPGPVSRRRPPAAAAAGHCRAILPAGMS